MLPPELGQLSNVMCIINVADLMIYDFVYGFIVSYEISSGVQFNQPLH